MAFGIQVSRFICLYILYSCIQEAEAEYTQMMESCRDLGITNAGNYAFRWMRGGNCIPTYGVDFDVANSTPLEVALHSHPVDLYKVEYNIQSMNLAKSIKLNGLLQNNSLYFS